MMGRMMGRGRWRRGRLVLFGVLVASLTGLGSTLLFTGAGATGASRVAGEAALPSNPPAAVVSRQSAAAVYAYWTPARMAAAKPAAGATAGGPNIAAGAAGNTATGAPGLAGGYVPAGLSSVSGTGSSINRSATDATVSPADGSYPGPNDTFNWWESQGQFPVSAIGKLFFTEPSGDYVCSATATYASSSQPNMIWTAGHCLGPQGGSSYYSNWDFCPEYKNGEAGVGCWAANYAQLTGGWYYDGYWSADYGYIILQATGNKKAKPVTSVVGGLGFGWNWSRDQIWQDFGYPSASPYTGAYLVDTSAEHRYDVTNPNGTAGSDPGQQDDSIGSAQTPGFSGGPWILSFGRDSSQDPLSHGDWINGNNSYYFTSGGPGGGNEEGIEIQSPYYDTNACNFWKTGSDWSGTC